MPTVEPIPNCPKGLEYLTQLDQVLIKQEVHLMEGKLGRFQFHVIVVLTHLQLVLILLPSMDHSANLFINVLASGQWNG